MRAATRSRITKARKSFDVIAFHAALDSQRVAKNLNWQNVAEQSGVPASTLCRMGQAQGPSTDNLALLLAWSGLGVASFIPNSSTPEPLAIITGALRADPNLSPENAQVLEEIIKVAYQQLRNKQHGADTPEEVTQCPS